MKRNNFFGVWHRCPICGTIFSDKLELREHQDLHRQSPKALDARSADKTEINAPPTQPAFNLSRKKFTGWEHKE